MTPTDKMQLNVPVTGNIAINCANGEGMPLPFYIEPVSTKEGKLTIDVCDENTYYTKEAPHLAGAKIEITHPTTGAVVAEGITNEKGLFSADLPEGYYAVRVSAEKHDSYSNNLLVDPGKDNQTTVNLSITGVQISYDVVETEIEDRYEIVTTTKFETQVPRPVVVASAPKSINGDNMKNGESVVINFVLTNKGLINAEKVKLYLPQSLQGWTFQPLEEIKEFTLAPQCSKSFPILITRVEPSTNLSRGASTYTNSPISACMAGMEHEYAWRCGKLLKKDKSLYRMALKTCANSVIMSTLADAISGGIGGFGGGTVGPGVPGNSPTGGNKINPYEPTEKEQVISTYDPLCDPNRTKCGEALLNKLLGSYPGAGEVLDKINDAADKAIDAAENGGNLPPDEVAEMANDLAKEASDAIKGGGDALDDL